MVNAMVNMRWLAASFVSCLSSMSRCAMHMHTAWFLYTLGQTLWSNCVVKPTMNLIVLLARPRRPLLHKGVFLRQRLQHIPPRGHCILMLIHGKGEPPSQQRHIQSRTTLSPSTHGRRCSKPTTARTEQQTNLLLQCTDKANPGNPG